MYTTKASLEATDHIGSKEVCQDCILPTSWQDVAKTQDFVVFCLPLMIQDSVTFILRVCFIAS